MSSLATILVVEDDVIIAMRLQDTLEAWSYKTYACHSGSKAIELARQVQPDLALMDINLNGKMDGIQTAQALFELDCPSIFLTAYSDDELLERAKQAQPSGYLVKPVYDRELRSTLEMALVKQRSERQVRESERRLRTIFDHTGVGLALMDAQTHQLVVANSRLWEILGEPEGEGTLDWMWMAEPQAEAAGQPENPIERLLRGEIRQFSIEKCFSSPAGAERWVNLTVSAAWSAQEVQRLAVIVAEECSARKQAEQALRQRVTELEG